MDPKFAGEEPPYDPLRTQKLKIELTRVGDTDKHRSQELLMHILENLEKGVDENREATARSEDRAANALRAHWTEYPHLSDEHIKNLIAGAFMLDAKNRDEAAKKRYFARIFWRAIAPLATAAGTGLSAFAHSLITHWHVVPK